MKKMGRIIFVITIIVTIVINLISCSATTKIDKKNLNSTAKYSPTKLRFLSGWGGVDTKTDGLQQVLNRFMDDNPDIEVINESLFGDDFLPKLKTDFASGNDPDVFGIWPGSDIRALIKAKKVADLTDLIESDKAWKDSFKESGWSYTTYNNRIFGLPLEIIYEGLFINKDLFDKYSVRVPSTYEDLKSAVKIFKENDVIPIAYNSFSQGTYLYQNIIAVLGGKEEVENPFKDGKVNRCYLDAANYTKELYELGAFPEDAFTISSKERNNLFKSKRAAMIVQGSWFIGDLREIEDTVDIIPFPRIDQEGSHEGALVYGLGGGCFFISQKAWEDEEKRLAAIKLLKELTSKESATFFAVGSGMLSNVKIDESKVGYSRLAKRGQEMIRNAKELIGPPDNFVDRGEWERTIVKEFPYVLAGREKAEVLWEKVMKKTLEYK